MASSPTALAPDTVAIASTSASGDRPDPAAGGQRVGGEAHGEPRVEVVRRRRTVGAEGDGHAGGEELGDPGEAAASFWFDAGQWATAAPLAATSSRSWSSRCTPWASTVRRSEEPRVTAAPRSACGRGERGRHRARRRSRRRGRGRVRRLVAASVADGAELVLVEQVGAVRADPAPARRRGLEQLGGPRHALVEAAAVGAGELDEHRPATEVEPGGAGHGGRGFREEVHVEGRRDAGPQALGDGERRPGGDRRLRQHGALGRQQASEEAVEVEVVGEAAEHRHRQVGVGVDQPRHDDGPAGVDRRGGPPAARPWPERCR